MNMQLVLSGGQRPQYIVQEQEGRQVEQNATRKNHESYEKKLQYQEAMGMYLVKEEVVAQCQKTQS
jgi:hypothetical protein